MIHQYQLGGYNIVLDICSGSVHAVDDVAYDIISVFETKNKEDIIADMCDKYLNLDGITEKDIEESINENKPTVIFSETAVKAENTTKTYKQFDYYIPTISGMHANCNLLNGGKITIVKGDNPVFGEESNTPVVPEEK